MSDPLTAEEAVEMANDLDYISRTLDRASKGELGHVRQWAQADLPEMKRIINRLRSAALSTTPAPDPDSILATLTEDDLMYDYPVAQSGEPMDPVLFVRWDALRAKP